MWRKLKWPAFHKDYRFYWNDFSYLDVAFTAVVAGFATAIALMAMI